jgi:hypothetical protein
MDFLGQLQKLMKELYSEYRDDRIAVANEEIEGDWNLKYLVFWIILSWFQAVASKSFA